MAKIVRFDPVIGSAGAAVVACLALLSFAARAQQSPGDAKVLGTVVVTAQKRAQQLQDVPMSVSALSGETLSRMGAEAFEDYARTVPGVNFESYGPTGIRGVHNIIIRGISSTGGIANTYGFYLDETPVATVDPRLYDIERVEVLRGPQGTLYGASSMGGTIKVISAKPDASAFDASTQLTLSDTHEGGENYGVDAMFNVPLVGDRLALRVVGTYQEYEGYIDRISRLVPPQNAPVTENVDDESSWNARATLRFTPSDRFTIDLSANLQDVEVDNLPGYDLNLERDLTQARDVQEPNDEEFSLYNLTIRYDFGPAELVSSTSYFEREAIENRELTELVRLFFGPLTNPTSLDSLTRDEEITQEVRLSSTGDGRLGWLVGAYYKDRPKAGWLDFQALDPTLPDPPVVNGNLITGHREVEQSELAAFGELSFRLTERLEAAVGLRWFDTEQDLVNTENGLFAAGANNFTGSASEDGTTPRFYLAYHVSDAHLIYAQAAQGFRLGGVNRPVPVPPCGPALAALGLTAAPQQFDSDSLWNYEVGAKTTWLDNRMIANVSAYEIDWTDMQQTIPLSCGFNFTGNVGEATSRGVELELALQPLDQLEIRAMAAYTKAELESDAPSLGGQEGERMLHVPEWTFSISLNQSFGLTENWAGYAHIDYQWVDDAYDNFNQNDPNQVRTGYDLTNLRLGVQNDRWNFALFARNVFNERPVLADIGDIGVAGSRKVVTTRPRTIGLMVSMDF
jgi:outer membrane receptor protein involved in Fe transport